MVAVTGVVCLKRAFRRWRGSEKIIVQSVDLVHAFMKYRHDTDISV